MLRVDGMAGSMWRGRIGALVVAVLAATLAVGGHAGIAGRGPAPPAFVQARALEINGGTVNSTSFTNANTAGNLIAVNPGTPVGATLPGAQIVALAAGPPRSASATSRRGVRLDAKPARAEPERDRPMVMQKAIAPSQVAYYLERGYDRVSGFVHRASEVAHLTHPGQLYHALGPGATPARRSPPTPTRSTCCAGRRTGRASTASRTAGSTRPAMRAMEGWVIERPPFRGNGFAPGESSDVVAEFKVDSARLPHGAQLWRIGADGAERLVARRFDARRWSTLAPGRTADVMRDGYVARWRGREYEASPDGDDMRLYRRAGRGLRGGPRRAATSGCCRPSEVDELLLRADHVHVAGRAVHRARRARRLAAGGVHRRQGAGGPRRSGWRSSTSASTRAGRPPPRSPTCASSAAVSQARGSTRRGSLLGPAQDLAGDQVRCLQVREVPDPVEQPPLVRGDDVPARALRGTRQTPVSSAPCSCSVGVTIGSCISADEPVARAAAARERNAQR